MKYLVIVTPGRNGFSARAPDVEGCVATGRTPDQVERQMRAALEFHVADLRQRGQDPPPPRSYSMQLEIVAASADLTVAG